MNPRRAQNLQGCCVVLIGSTIAAQTPNAKPKNGRRYLGMILVKWNYGATLKTAMAVHSQAGGIGSTSWKG